MSVPGPRANTSSGEVRVSPVEMSITDGEERRRNTLLFFAGLLERGDLDKFGQLLDEHWQNKKRRSAAISAVAIDRWYALARENGALGGKLIGAGGGGFLMLYCPGPARPASAACSRPRGLREMPFGFDVDGAKVLVNF